MNKQKFFGPSKKSSDGKKNQDLKKAQNEVDPPESSDGRATRKQEKERPVSANFESFMEKATTQAPVKKTYAYKPNRKSSLTNPEASNSTKSSANDVQSAAASDPTPLPDTKGKEVSSSKEVPPVETSKGSPKSGSKGNEPDKPSTPVENVEEPVIAKKPLKPKRSKGGSKSSAVKDEPTQEVVKDTPEPPKEEPQILVKENAIAPKAKSKSKKPPPVPVETPTSTPLSEVPSPSTEVESPKQPSVQPKPPPTQPKPPPTQPKQTPTQTKQAPVPTKEIPVPPQQSPIPANESAESSSKIVDAVSEVPSPPTENAPQERSVRQKKSRKLASFPSKSDTQGDESLKAFSEKAEEGLGKKKDLNGDLCTINFTSFKNYHNGHNILLNTGHREETLTCIHPLGTPLCYDGFPDLLCSLAVLTYTEDNSNISSAVTASAPDSSVDMQPQVRVLSLNHNEHLESTVFRLQKGYVLQFRPGPTLFGKKVNVFTNHPESAAQDWQQESYRRLPWKSDSTNKGDDTALYVEVTIHLAGSYHFYFTYDDSEDQKYAAGSGYFLVDPVLTRGTENEVLPLDCVQCQTVMAKCLGSMDGWMDRLRVSKESGYNMIHFTPIQKLGISRSGYSLADQLALNPNFSSTSKQYGMKDVETIITKMRDEWKVLSLIDIVLNHTANESPWLKEHPECTYNMVTAPHLRPAYLLDRVLYHFSIEVANKQWESRGIPVEVNQECHVQAIGNVLYDVLSKPHVEEFFMVDITALVKEFQSKLQDTIGGNQFEGRDEKLSNLMIIQDPNYRRFKSTVDMELAQTVFNVQWPGHTDEESRRYVCCEEFRGFLEKLNQQKKEETEGHLRQAVNCTLGTIRYERLQEDGPKIPAVSKKHPFTQPYFTHYGPDMTIEEEEKLSLGPDSRFLMAHNGWVMSYDPLKNFALEGSNVYLRRELVSWGDSVKLRYGDKPSDCPYLWEHMRKYVEQMARIFIGIRLDNCHSTPIHVAEYLLYHARKVRPDLYVIAELFTNSDAKDNVFVNRLGINSLIREAMSAPDSHEEGRLVYRYGGEPVGAFILPPVRPLTPSVAHAIFLDLTHDNRSPCEVRSGWDMLPSTALVNMACCASGSNRGYDEIVPHHIHVVNEERKYTSWSDSKQLKTGQVNGESGIIKAKKLLNDLHYELGKNGYSQVFVDQVTEHVVTITRHNPVTHQSVVLVAFTSFKPPSLIGDGFIRPLKVQGKFEEIIFEFNLKSKDPKGVDKKVPGDFSEDTAFINGVNDFILDVKTSLQPAQSSLVRQVSPPGADTTEFEYTTAFRPGSVIAFRLSLLPPAQESVNKIRKILSDFSYKKRISEVSNQNKELLEIISQLSLSDLNRVLFRCDQEERDEGRGWGAYNIPNFGSFVYCGLQGIISLFTKIRNSNDLGHPACGNLRDGNWMMDYVSGRLKLEPATERLGLWLEEVFSYMKGLPRYLIPAYFDAVVTAVYFTLINQSWLSMGGFIAQGSDFAKALGLCCVEFCGAVKSALLPQLSPKLSPPRPPTSKDKYGRVLETSVTLSAGLPHFSTGYLRNWGRDTFIALPGNLLITGRFQEARWIILAFASTLRHGLIPNLLDGGPKARFNCRDATWFWLYSIRQYVRMVPDGHTIFKDKVSRIFPKDDSPNQPAGAFDQTLEEVMQEALQRHFQGVKFRERNAGPQIDSQMTDEGFNVEIGVDLNTGFPFGGSIHNCGTWMDKMGSSEVAGNKGKPATPRDGSAVEIVGLCKATVKFLAEMHKEGKYPYGGVLKNDETGNVINWNFKFWETMIGDNFEKLFWINDTPDPKNEPRQDLINRRGIYKDSVGASQPWADYQLRCNFPIAIAVAPEMCTPERALIALKNAEKILLGPLGIKTLDPSDWAYRGDYDNANDSTDPSVARGFNYHQGPEWVWPVGFLLRAMLAIASRLGSEQLAKTKSHIKSILAAHLTHTLSSPWRSLPELTNSNGAFCRDSNPAQSWSTGCVLEVLYDMDQLEGKQS